MATTIVRVGFVRGVSCRVIRGWRADSIDRCLDFCSSVLGYAHVGWAAENKRDTAKSLDRAGRRTRIYASAAEARRMWARMNPDKARENSKRQWQKIDARNREQYAKYCSMYREYFPGSVPIGYDRWRRYFLKLWQASPEQCMVINQRGDTRPDGAPRFKDGQAIQAPPMAR